MSDRIAVFNEGRIEQVGTPGEIYEQPASAFVAGFVGTSNLLTGAAAAGRRSARTGTFAIRPEKIRVDRRRAPVPGRPRSTGAIREVVYLGSANRYVVDLDAGDRTSLSRAPAEPAHLCRRSRPTGAATASASAGSPSTSSSSGQPHPPPPRSQHESTHASWPSLTAVAALAAHRRRLRLVRRRRQRQRQAARASRRPKCRWPRSSAPARARSASWPGPGTPRTAATTRRSTG